MSGEEPVEKTKKQRDTGDTGSTQNVGESERDRSETGSISPDALERLQTLERNTIAETGTVLQSMIVEYDEDVEPEVVQETVISAVADHYSIEQREAADRLVSSSQSLLSDDYFGKHAFVVVALPSEDVFVDRIFLPDEELPGAESGSRYQGFVSTYGTLAALPELENERVPIWYDLDADRWKIDCTTDRDQDTRRVPSRLSALTTAGLYLVSIGLFGYTALMTFSVPTSPAFGELSPQTAVFVTLVALFVAFVLDIVRTGVKYVERRAVTQ